MITVIKEFLTRNQLDGSAKRVQVLFRKLYRNAVGMDRRLVKRYLVQHEIAKLHIGCGDRILNGWLNTDYSPTSNDIVLLDATGLYPFKNKTFDYVFSEHMIEHVSHANGRMMLRECFRVLKHGGKIRLTTPDLLFLCSLYKDNKSELQHEYIKWAAALFLDEGNAVDTFVINYFVRNWGHQFIYDEKVLRHSMEGAGFQNIVRCDLNESESIESRNLENVERMPPGFLKLESITLEGTKM